MPFEPNSFIYTMDNVGDGEVWGIEFDLSTPLDFIGMETTGVFLNYSWLDSAVNEAVSLDQEEDAAMTAFFEGTSDTRTRRFGWRR